MTVAKKIHFEPFDVANRLADLDQALDAELLRDFVRQGHAQFVSCTANHPPLYPGLSAWAEAIKAMRDGLMVFGWVRVNDSGLPFTVNKKATIALTVATGNEATGKKESEPSTKSSKGTRTAKAVAVNEAQYKLFAKVELSASDIKQLNESRRATWILLMHRDEIAGEVRCELSHPIKINEDGHVDKWAERIILEPLPFGGDTLEIPNDEAIETPDIAINVVRRA